MCLNSKHKFFKIFESKIIKIKNWTKDYCYTKIIENNKQ